MQIPQAAQNKWIRLSAGIVLFLLLIYAAVPLVGKHYLIKFLQDNGADSVKIERLAYNPFAAKLILEGLDVEKDGKSILSESRIAINMRLFALFKKDIFLEESVYNDLSIDLEQYPDGRWRIGFFIIDNDGSTENVQEVSEQAASAWAVLADNVSVKNCRIQLKTPALTLQLVIDKAELKKFSTRSDMPAGTFHLEGSINESPITIAFQKIEVLPEIKLEGDLSLDKFQLQELAKLLSDVIPVFEGVFGLDGRVAFHLLKDGNIRVKYDGSLGLLQPVVSTGAISTEGEKITWNGSAQYHSTKDSPLAVTIKGALKGEALSFMTGDDLPDAPVQSGGLSLDWNGDMELTSGDQNKGMSVSTGGTLQLSNINFVVNEGSAPFSVKGDNAIWKGALGFKQLADEAGNLITLKGKLVTEKLEADLPENHLLYTHEGLTIVADTTIGLSEGFDVKGENEVGFTGISLADSSKDSELLSAKELSFKGFKGEGGTRIKLGEVTAEDVAASITGAMPLQVQVPKIHLTEIETNDMQIFAGRNLEIVETRIHSPVSGEDLVTLSSVDLQGIQASLDGNLSLQMVTLKKLVALGTPAGEEAPPTLSLESASLNDISWNKTGGLQADTLNFDHLSMNAVRNKEGVFEFQQKIAAMNSSLPVNAQQETEGENSSETVPVSLKEIVFTGENSIRFEDYTLAVPYKSHIEINTLRLLNLNSALPEDKTELTFEGRLAERAPVAVKGDIYPFKEKLELRLELDVKNYPLHRLSSYTVQSVGTALSSGELRLESSVELAENILDMQNHVILQKLETETISEELAKELDNQLPMSLDAALSLLRDSDDNITLDIPLEGPVDDLGVGIADVLVTALSKAIVPAASGYLVYALGPYGALAYVGMKVGEKILQVDLPPVVFAEGESQFEDTQLDYLSRVAKILLDRPKQDLQICPIVVPWELLPEKEREIAKDTREKDGDIKEADVQKLFELGQQRAAAVQKYLVDKHEIEEQRLLICDTKIEKEKSGVPSVTMHMSKL